MADMTQPDDIFGNETKREISGTDARKNASNLYYAVSPERKNAENIFNSASSGLKLPANNAPSSIRPTVPAAQQNMLVTPDVRQQAPASTLAGSRNTITPNASKSPFSAVAPGGQGIFKDANTGKTGIVLSGDSGRQFMNDRNASGLSVSGSVAPVGAPQDVYALMGRNPNMTSQFNDLTKPITQQEIESYRLGKGNAPGMASLAGGKDIFGDTQQLLGQYQTLLNQIDAHSKQHPVAPNDVQGMLNNRVATKDLRDQAFDIATRLMARDTLSANIFMNLENNRSKNDVAGVKSDTQLAVADKNAQAKTASALTAADSRRDVEGMRGKTALTISEKTNALNEHVQYTKSLNDQAELYRKTIKDLQENDPGNPELENMRKALKATIAEASRHASDGRPNMATGISFAK